MMAAVAFGFFAGGIVIGLMVGYLHGLDRGRSE